MLNAINNLIQMPELGHPTNFFPRHSLYTVGSPKNVSKNLKFQLQLAQATC